MLDKTGFYKTHFIRIFEGRNTILLFFFGLSGLLYFSLNFGVVAASYGLESALKGFLVFFSQANGDALAIHLYTPVFYFGFFTFILIPLYLTRALPYLVLIWAANEWIFNTSYTLMYPYNWTLINHEINWIYLGALGATAIVVIIFFRRSFRFSYLTLAFPIFFAIWALLGMPLMLPGEHYTPYITSNAKNFFWELFYQITLCASFVGSVRREKI